MSREATKKLAPQQRLSKFLYAELLHTLGSYQLAENELDKLRKRSSGGPQGKVLRVAIERSWLQNEALRAELHKPQLGDDPKLRCRHPSPFEHRADRTPDAKLLVSVRTYYRRAGEALHLYLRAIKDKRKPTSVGELLGGRLAYIHDPEQRGGSKAERALVEDRVRRTLHRLDKVDELIDPEHLTVPPPMVASGFDAILGDHMEHKEPDPGKGEVRELPLHLTVVQALSDAHDWMHECEHLRSKAFGEMFSQTRKTHLKTEAMLKRSIALNTFVYVVARSAPWIFAEDEQERAAVCADYRDCHGSFTPSYCMWIGSQLALIALERRAYTWWTMGRNDRAHRDFYKLTRLLKRLRSEVDERATRVPGTKTLVVGLTATAEHHIGRIYRGQHAHRVAVRYFDRASAHLEGWENHDEVGDILKDSRWHLNLLINRGKASYELGRITRSLLSYAQAWRAYLQLVEVESHLTANFKVVEEVIEWLKSIEDEPALSKVELRVRVEPLVKQFETMDSPIHLRLLAADIMMRLGHLLHVLKLPSPDWTPEDLEQREPIPDYELARRCMFKAAALDRTSTLIATDLLKIRHGMRLAKRAEETRNPGQRSESEPDFPKMASLQDQWPAGGGNFEEAARAIEYVVQTWLDSSSSEDGRGELPPRAEIARGLLRSFLAHTDSSNVKLAQVYRYLMQKPREDDRDAIESTPTIEIVCLRRYSSFFPFLPRPAAFRALGGGYLVQVREADERRGPFGIAIDPGPHFLHNLYRCGYGLADIHMVIATHDHADHIASLDALLALMGYRGLLGDNTFGDQKRLLIVGNDSVVERYSFYNRDQPVKLDGNDGSKQAERLDAVRVMSFSKFNRITRRKDDNLRRRELKRAGISLTPESLRIQPVKTIDHFDAAGHVSQGFLLSMGRTKATRSSVLFTGDTGPQPKATAADGKRKPRHYFAKGTKSLNAAAAEADIVIAHLSSVPLPELRTLAGLSAVADNDGPAQTFIDLWKKVGREARKSDLGAAEAEFLLRQLQFAFRSRGWDQKTFAISPFSHTKDMRDRSEKHLFLSGLLDLAKLMVESRERGGPKPLLLIGELREELGTFRTRIASRVTETVFARGKAGTALTTDIGLRLRVSRSAEAEEASVSVLCTTCDLDNDLVTSERFHKPSQMQEVCVKGENESIFYNCDLHDPSQQPEPLWVESVERYNVFGD
jgi:tetratricopeptide (TPR) repeat protein